MDLTRTRFLVLVAATVIAAAIVGWSWYDGLDSEHRQGPVLTTLAVGSAWVVFTVLWWSFVSGCSVRVRLGGLGGLTLVVAALACIYEYDGLDGDFVPRFRSRFDAVDVVRPEGPLSASQAEWPGFLGRERRGVVEGVELEPDWETHPPRLRWRIEVGRGWSSFAVARGLAVTQEQHGDEEQVVCYRLDSSEVLWRVGDDTAYESKVAGDGPRATPTIQGDRVYSLGATGILRATELSTGRPVWRRDLAEEGAPLPPWGFSASPLWHDGAILTPVGGEGRLLMSFSAEDGAPRWSCGDDAVGYASCAIHRLQGLEQVVLLHASAISGHDLDSGVELWSHPWETQQANVAQPIELGANRLMVSTGYGVGAQAFDVQRDGERWTTQAAWRGRSLKSKFANMLVVEDSVYGLDDGMLTCIDRQSGRRRWKDGRDGHGQLLRVGSHLLLLAESGRVILLEFDPEGRRELASFQALDDETWNPPAFAPPHLLVRNGREAALWELPLKTPR